MNLLFILLHTRGPKKRIVVKRSPSHKPAPPNEKKMEAKNSKKLFSKKNIDPCWQKKCEALKVLFQG
jgi:hypothetical protein